MSTQRKETIALHPEEPGNYQNLALVYLANGNPEKARESLVEARKLVKSPRQGRAIERRIRKIATGWASHLLRNLIDVMSTGCQNGNWLLFL